MLRLGKVALLGCTLVAMNVAPIMAQGMRHEKSMRKKIEDLRKIKLLEILELEGNQVEKFFAVYNKHQRNIENLREQVNRSTSEVQGMLDSDESEAKVTQKVDEIRKQIRDLSKEIDVTFDEAKAVLTARQYAQYVVFEARFRDELERKIFERIKRKREADAR